MCTGVLGSGHGVWGASGDPGHAYVGLALAARFVHNPTLHLRHPLLCTFRYHAAKLRTPSGLQLPCLMRVCLCDLQWLPESARYDVLSGNQEKALNTLKRIATENKVPMPLGKLIVARQVAKPTIQLSSALFISIHHIHSIQLSWPQKVFIRVTWLHHQFHVHCSAQ